MKQLTIMLIFNLRFKNCSKVKHLIYRFNIILLLFLLGPQNASADFLSTAWRDFTSPVTTDAKYYLYSGSLLTAALTIDSFEDSIGHDVQDETTENKPLGDASKVFDLAGQMIPNAVYIGVMYGLYLSSEEEHYKRKTIHMLKSTLYSGLAANILKVTIREPRPNTSNGRESFPSGHTTTAFAFASVIGTEHEWYWGAAAYTMASLVAFSRINDNAHRLHDVVGGAVLGLSYGLSIHYLYKNEKSEIAKISISPYGDGMMFNYRAEF